MSRDLASVVKVRIGIVDTIALKLQNDNSKITNSEFTISDKKRLYAKVLKRLDELNEKIAGGEAALKNAAFLPDEALVRDRDELARNKAEWDELHAIRTQLENEDIVLRVEEEHRSRRNLPYVDDHIERVEGSGLHFSQMLAKGNLNQIQAFPLFLPMSCELAYSAPLLTDCNAGTGRPGTVPLGHYRHGHIEISIAIITPPISTVAAISS